MNVFVTILTLFLVTLSIQAQQISTIDNGNRFPASTVQSAPVFGAMDDFHSTAGEVSKTIFHFDIAKPIAVRQFPMNAGTAVIAMIGQRFTVPGTNAKLDSVRVFFPTVASGDVVVWLLRDTLAPLGTSPDLFHFPNLYNSYGFIDTIRIVREDIVGGQNVNVPVAGQEMAPNFHVMLQPVDRGDFQPAFTAAMSLDSVLFAAQTPENSRVPYLALVGAGSALGFYSEYTADPDHIHLPNMLMSATLRFESATGIDPLSTAAGMLISDIYPHPVSQTREAGATLGINLAHAQKVDIAVYDVMGKKVRSIATQDMPQGQSVLHLNSSGLAPGSYVIKMQARSGVVTKNLILTR
jgi:Secretion system C-terminal sorting domain